jgi:peptidoglycan/xylan/chitin deacetylase (PgdA/CDA1 family)
LTFDDGPDSDGTPRALDALRRGNARATFFLQGSHAMLHPALVSRIVAEGHEIGHHSWSHSAPASTDAATLADEVVRTRTYLHSLVGIDSTLFRPPHGKVSVGKLRRLWALGQSVVLWSADPGDVFQTSAEAFISWFEHHPPRAGDIILLHDKAPVLADALPLVIDLIRKRGLSFSTVGDIIGRPATANAFESAAAGTR